MLNMNNSKRAMTRAVFCTVFLVMLLSCNFRKANDENFSIYLGKRNFRELVQIINNHSARHGFRVTIETLEGKRPETTAQQIMVERSGMRVLIQSALAEQCSEQEGRRDVEYSHSVFDVNAFSTSWFVSISQLSMEVEQLKTVLSRNGFRVLSKQESCSIL